MEAHQYFSFLLWGAHNQAISASIPPKEEHTNCSLPVIEIHLVGELGQRHRARPAYLQSSLDVGHQAAIVEIALEGPELELAVVEHGIAGVPIGTHPGFLRHCSPPWRRNSFRRKPAITAIHDTIAFPCRNKDRNGRLVCCGTGRTSQASCFLNRYVSMTHPFRALASARIRSMSCMSSRSFPATRISSSVPIYAPQ